MSAALRPQRDRPVVLVVDDDATMRLMACETLSLEGFEISEAVDGAEALSVLPSIEPDLVLLDVKMPRMDGFETLRELRKRPRWRFLPVLVMTGLDDLSSIRQAYEVGATDFVNKPINWVLLGHRVEYILRASRHSDELRQSRAKLANAQRIAGLGYWEWSPPGDRLLLSGEMARILGVGYDDRETSVEEFLESVHPDDRDRVGEGMRDCGAAGEIPDLEYRLVNTGGTQRFVRQQVEKSRSGQGQVVRATGAVQDVTERKDAEEQIRFLAYYDALTSLPNRRAFAERLEVSLAGSQLHSREGAILFLDLDRFKRINETLGHRIGDRLLQEVASRLLDSVRTGDQERRPGGNDLVARFGGDEFVLLLNEISEPRDAAEVAQRLADALDMPFVLGGQELFVHASIGIAIFPHDGTMAEELCSHAEIAMSHAKGRGGKSCQYYSASMNATALQRLAMESDLRRALEGDQFEVVYQPQLDLRTRQVVGVEALIRWHHPTMGFIRPASFIPLAEETGLIEEIGQWVLSTACRQAKTWQSHGAAPIRVSVNLSGRQFGTWSLARKVARALREAGLEPQLLELELTESILMRDEEVTSRSLRELKEIGVRLAIDDFGTGYSSLSYLGRFPLDALKIDQTFLRGVPEEPGNVAITTAILAMAKSLGLQAIAEGVEEEAQVQFLAEQNCDLMQGYLLSKPVLAEELAGLLGAGLLGAGEEIKATARMLR